MNKVSALFLTILIMMALLAIYEAMLPLSVTTAFIRYLALVAFGFICISLVIGPLVIIWPKQFAQLIEPRRAIGIAAFFFAIAHVFLVIAINYGWNIESALTFEPLTVIALILLVILAAISNDYSIKKLGVTVWKNIQRANYLIFLIIMIHFIKNSTGLLIQPGSVNLAEALMILFGVMTVVLQIMGLIVRRQRL